MSEPLNARTVPATRFHKFAFERRFEDAAGMYTSTVPLRLRRGGPKANTVTTVSSKKRDKDVSMMIANRNDNLWTNSSLQRVDKSSTPHDRTTNATNNFNNDNYDYSAKARLESEQLVRERADRLIYRQRQEELERLAIEHNKQTATKKEMKISDAMDAELSAIRKEVAAETIDAAKQWVNMKWRETIREYEQICGQGSCSEASSSPRPASKKSSRATPKKSPNRLSSSSASPYSSTSQRATPQRVTSATKNRLVPIPTRAVNVTAHENMDQWTASQKKSITKTQRRVHHGDAIKHQVSCISIYSKDLPRSRHLHQMTQCLPSKTPPPVGRSDNTELTHRLTHSLDRRDSDTRSESEVSSALGGKPFPCPSPTLHTVKDLLRSPSEATPASAPDKAIDPTKENQLNHLSDAGSGRYPLLALLATSFDETQSASLSEDETAVNNKISSNDAKESEMESNTTPLKDEEETNNEIEKEVPHRVDGSENEVTATSKYQPVGTDLEKDDEVPDQARDHQIDPDSEEEEAYREGDSEDEVAATLKNQQVDSDSEKDDEVSDHTSDEITATKDHQIDSDAEEEETHHRDQAAVTTTIDEHQPSPDIGEDDSHLEGDIEDEVTATKNHQIDSDGDTASENEDPSTHKHHQTNSEIDEEDRRGSDSEDEITATKNHQPVDSGSEEEEAHHNGGDSEDEVAATLKNQPVDTDSENDEEVPDQTNNEIATNKDHQIESDFEEETAATLKNQDVDSDTDIQSHHNDVNLNEHKPPNEVMPDVGQDVFQGTTSSSSYTFPSESGDDEPSINTNTITTTPTPAQEVAEPPPVEEDGPKPTSKGSQKGKKKSDASTGKKDKSKEKTKSGKKKKKSIPVEEDTQQKVASDCEKSDQPAPIKKGKKKSLKKKKAEVETDTITNPLNTTQSSAYSYDSYNSSEQHPQPTEEDNELPSSDCFYNSYSDDGEPPSPEKPSTKTKKSKSSKKKNSTPTPKDEKPPPPVVDDTKASKSKTTTKTKDKTNKSKRKKTQPDDVSDHYSSDCYSEEPPLVKEKTRKRSKEPLETNKQTREKPGKSGLKKNKKPVEDADLSKFKNVSIGEHSHFIDETDVPQTRDEVESMISRNNMNESRGSLVHRSRAQSESLFGDDGEFDEPANRQKKRNSKKKVKK